MMERRGIICGLAAAGLKLGLVAMIVLGMAQVVCAAQGDEKVVESSSRRKPDWIGRTDGAHFAVTEQASTLSTATEKCLTSIRQYIASAVAVNVMVDEQMKTRQISRDESVALTTDYSSEVKTKAAELPFLSDITLSNAEQTYWEKIYNKRTGNYRYEYSVLYPFSEQTRAELVGEFLSIDRAKSAEYERLKSELAVGITNLDRIGQAVAELDVLGDYFFDATRKGEAVALQKAYRALYNRVAIEVETEEPGRCVYSLVLDGRRVETSHKPRLVSQSALKMSVDRGEGGNYVLTYDARYASKSEINTIEITYLWGAARVSKTLYFEPGTPKSN